MGAGLEYTPWALALATAVWFTWLAHRAGRSLVQWAITGLVFGLATATIVLGLFHAAGIPYSDQQRTVMHFKWTVAAVVVIAVLGWVVTAGLHRHHLKLWRRATGATPPPKKEPSPAPEPKAEASKPPSARA